MNTKEDREYIDSTIALIEEGKTYKKMWKKLRNHFLGGCINYQMDIIEKKYLDKTTFCKLVDEFKEEESKALEILELNKKQKMNEQKYFPKEVNNEN